MSTSPIGTTVVSADAALATLRSSRDAAVPIDKEEFLRRQRKVRECMVQQSIDALYLDATSSLRYFTGLQCFPSERLHGAILSSDGRLAYVCPHFEQAKIQETILLEGDFILWEEHEDPTEKVIRYVKTLFDGGNRILAIDHQTPFFTASRFQEASSAVAVVNGESLISACRRIKSSAEIALLSQAKAITLQIQALVVQTLYEGIDTRDVQAFLDQAHVRCGMDGRSTFKIVLFGEPTAYPHGVSYPQALVEGDMVLIDTGATLHGYHSDITRTYVFGEPTARQREIWNIEQSAQQAAFDAAAIDAPCSAPDAAARQVIEAAGLGPGYKTPGLPHRTGHGVGLEVHEHPYIVRGNDLPLAPGMCFSIEPMICCYGEFGVRLEDHVYMTDQGPRWFTAPSASIDQPF